MTRLHPTHRGAERGPVVVAVGRCNEPPARPHGQAILLHQPHDLLVVDDAAFAPQLGSHTPVAVSWPLGADGFDPFDELCLVNGLALGVVVVCRARQPHQPASFCD